jgi:hypothetical protein
VDKVSGPTCRLAGLLAGGVHLTRTSGTLVGGDPWVPMSHKPPSTCRRSSGDEVTSKRSEEVASMKPHRVHGDQKEKPSATRTKANIMSLESRFRGLK